MIFKLGHYSFFFSFLLFQSTSFINSIHVFCQFEPLCTLGTEPNDIFCFTFIWSLKHFVTCFWLVFPAINFNRRAWTSRSDLSSSFIAETSNSRPCRTSHNHVSYM